MEFNNTEEADFNSTGFDIADNFTVTDSNSTEVSPLKRYDFLNPMWNVSFTISVIVGTLGNLIVLWIVLCKHLKNCFF